MSYNRVGNRFKTTHTAQNPEADVYIGTEEGVRIKLARIGTYLTHKQSQNTVSPSAGFLSILYGVCDCKRRIPKIKISFT
jgi:hypothetical protein